MLDTTLLVTGLFFPTVSLLTYIAPVATRWKSGHYESPVLIPFIGPILLSLWVIVAGNSNWIIPFVWLLDLGTVAFLVVLPRLVREWWQISAFTRILTLRGTHGIQQVIFTIHRGGHYFLRRSWNRPNGELGNVDSGELGRFVDSGERLALESDYGLKRILLRVEGRSYVVAEEFDEDRPDLNEDSLDGWRLHS